MRHSCWVDWFRWFAVGVIVASCNVAFASGPGTHPDDPATQTNAKLLPLHGASVSTSRSENKIPDVTPQGVPSASYAYPAIASLVTVLGSAIYLGALVRSKSTLSTMTQSVLSVFCATVAWFLAAGELAYAQMSRSWLAPLTTLSALDAETSAHMFSVLPLVVLVACVLFGGAVERLRLSAVMTIAPLWTLFLVAPLLRAIHIGTGTLSNLGFADWIGMGTLNVAVGVSAMVIAIGVGNRHGYGRISFAPYNLSFALIGAFVMLTGWTIGLAATGAAHHQPLTTLATTNMFIAIAAGSLAWCGMEHFHRGTTSSLGMISGALAGAVAASTAAAWLSSRSAVAIGAWGALAGYFGAVVLRRLHERDESLDIFSIHALPAMAALLVLPLFAPKSPVAFSTQFVGVVLIGVYSACVTALIVVPLKLLGWLRVSFDEEDAGLDLITHGETVHPPQSTL